MASASKPRFSESDDRRFGYRAKVAIGIAGIEAEFF